jgi:hypothetical protein
MFTPPRKKEDEKEEKVHVLKQTGDEAKLVVNDKMKGVHVKTKLSRA